MSLKEQEEKLLGLRELDIPETRLSGLLLQPARILVSDDETLVREILLRKLTSLGYSCDTCANGREALELLESRPYDLVLADVMMPELGGVELLREVKSKWPDTAVILITSLSDLNLAVETLKEGAFEYLNKPFGLEEFSISVARALERRRLQIENREYRKSLEEQVSSRSQQLKEALEILQRTYQSTLVSLATALDSRDADADGHTVRVTLYTLRIARQLGLDETQLRVLEQGALLHDIGKLGIPDRLLRKPEKLSEEEWVLMKRHPEIGQRILSGISFLQEAADIVSQHQERFDGSGYPRGLKGEQICLGARIFMVADTFDGMTSNRPYYAAVSFEEAHDAIRALGRSKLDPLVVEGFLQIPLEEWKSIRAEVEERGLSRTNPGQ